MKGPRIELIVQVLRRRKDCAATAILSYFSLDKASKKFYQPSSHWKCYATLLTNVLPLVPRLNTVNQISYFNQPEKKGKKSSPLIP